jgi:hypothetical protein
MILALIVGFAATAVISFVLGGFLFAPGRRELKAQLDELKSIAEKYGYTAVRKLLER